MASSSTSSDISDADSTIEPTIGDGPAAGDVGAFASRAKQALDAWQTLEKALANISPHKQFISQVAEAVDRHVATETELQNKDAKIADLGLTNKTQLEIFCERYNEWGIEKKKLEEELKKKDTAAEENLKVVEKNLKASHAEDVDSIKKALESEKKRSATLSGKWEDAKLKIQMVEDRLAKCSAEVEYWNEHISDLKEVDFEKLKAKIKPLFDRCCKLARHHFYCDLPEGSFQSQVEWDTHTSKLNLRLLFPPSNSEVAKRVRMAACLHIIARNLCIHIFKPCYIPSASSFSDRLKEILIEQFRTDPEKERITRALILSTCSSDENTGAMTKTASESSSQILTLLNPLGANEKFEKELRKIFLDAGDLWKEYAQHSYKMVEAFTEVDIPGISWVIMDEFTIPATNTTTTTTAADTNIDPSQSSMLFPCIYVPEDANVLLPGARLFYSQGLMSAADQEYHDCNAARRQRNARNIMGGFAGGHQRGRERRMSYGEGRAGFLANSPAAAVTGDGATQQQRGAK